MLVEQIYNNISIRQLEQIARIKKKKEQLILNS